MNPSIIKNAATDDLMGIMAIMNHEILHTANTYDYSPKTMSDMLSWFQEQSRHNYPILVLKCVKTSDVLGYATYAQFRKKIGYRYCVEHSIYLSSDAQGKGLGSQLMSALIDRAKEQKIHTMIAGIDSENKGSIAFHKKFGFDEVGRLPETAYKFDSWRDLVFLQLTLP